MPVLISESQSDPRDGIINKDQMDKVCLDFQEDVAITTLDGNYNVRKTFACWYSRKELLLLLGVDPEAVQLPASTISGLRIYFGVHPFGQESCEGEDYSDKLNTVLLATVPRDPNRQGSADGEIIDDHMDLRNAGDFVLIPGYNKHDPNQGNNEACCGGMSGGGGH